jgi:hypothetical protein
MYIWIPKARPQQIRPQQQVLKPTITSDKGKELIFFTFHSTWINPTLSSEDSQKMQFEKGESSQASSIYKGNEEMVLVFPPPSPPKTPS